MATKNKMQLFNAKSFKFAKNATANAENIEGESITYWKDAWNRFQKNRVALVSFFVIVVLVLGAIFIPMFSSQTYDFQDLSKTFAVPESGHPFGFDHLGRDIWVRVWGGLRVSLVVALVATAINLFIGITFGMVSGFFGGKIDLVMQRIVEIIAGIPSIVLALSLIMILGPGIKSVVITIVLTGWIGMSRVTRSQVLRYKNREFVLASRTLGASNIRLMFKHLLPNILAPLIVMITFAIPSAIFYESFLSFLGLGIQSPNPSLGILLSEGNQYLIPTLSISDSAHVLLWPAFVMFSMMLAFNFIANAARDALDPNMRGKD